MTFDGESTLLLGVNIGFEGTQLYFEVISFLEGNVFMERHILVISKGSALLERNVFLKGDVFLEGNALFERSIFLERNVFLEGNVFFGEELIFGGEGTDCVP